MVIYHQIAPLVALFNSLLVDCWDGTTMEENARQYQSASIDNEWSLREGLVVAVDNT